MLMLLTKFVPDSTIRRCCFFTFLKILMLNQHQIRCKFVQNSTRKVHNQHHCRKLKQIQGQKGAGTKMQKRLVGRMSYLGKAGSYFLTTFFNSRLQYSCYLKKSKSKAYIKKVTGPSI